MVRFADFQGREGVGGEEVVGGPEGGGAPSQGSRRSQAVSNSHREVGPVVRRCSCGKHARTWQQIK